MPKIYRAEEDSYLLSEALKKELPSLLKKKKDLRFLEIGCGSGINLETAKKAGVKIKNILGTDINEEAINHCKKLGFKCVKSDLFNKIPKQKFDIIAFNPPYLPLDKKEPKESRMETTGGKKGNEITIRFLKEAQKHLEKEGRIFVITSSLSQEVDFSRLGYAAKIVSSKKLFFEKLSVWECLKI